MSFHGFFVPAFGSRDPCTDRVDLDVRLLDPVVLLLRDHRLAQLAEARHLGFRRRRIAAARRAEASRVGVDGFAFGEWRPIERRARGPQRELRCLRPFAALEREARRNRSRRVGDLTGLLVQRLVRLHELDPFARVRVPRRAGATRTSDSRSRDTRRDRLRRGMRPDFVSIESCHWPTREKMCDGMCNACGESGAIAA